jgi:hypothetical protein
VHEDEKDHGENEAEDHVVQEVRGQPEDDAGVVPHPVVEMKGHESERQKEDSFPMGHRPEA